MQIVRVVNFFTRKYDVGQLYLDGTILKLIRPEVEDDLIFGTDLDLDEAAEYAADYGKGVRVFTDTWKYTRRQRKTGTGWPKN
jgi:hypothetical protein